MKAIVHKAELAKFQAQFIHDLNQLRKNYSNHEIARKISIGEANLSSYGSGKKLPGFRVLMQFYEAFSGEIQNPFKSYANPVPSHVDEIRLTYESPSVESYRENEILELLKRQNAHLSDSFDKIVAANQKLVQSTLMLAEANKKLVEQLMSKNQP